MYGFLLFDTEIISLIAAPVGAVTIPMVLGNLGIGFLNSLSNRPCSASRFLSSSNLTVQSPTPSYSTFVTLKVTLPLGT